MPVTFPDPEPGRLRVLQVIGNAIVGGMETFVMRFCAALVARGCVVVCLCPYESAATTALRALGCAVHVAPLPDEPVWRGIEYATSLVVDGEIDVIHAHLVNAHLLAGIVGRLTGTPVLATVHGRDVTVPDLSIHRLADTHLHVVSHATLHQALAAGVRRDRITCLTNGVDASRFCPDAIDAAQGSTSAASRASTVATAAVPLRAACGIDAGTPLFAFVGRLSPEKGPEQFVRVAASVFKRVPNAHAAMIGDGGMRPAVLEQAIAAGIADRLHLVGVRDDVVDCLRSIDLLLSTSHSEGTPLSIMEAQACGVPVVAMHVGGLPEIVSMGETGVLVAPGDVTTMVDATVSLLGDPTSRTAFGEAARRRMIERFDLDERHAALAALLDTIVHTTAPAVRRGSRRAALSSV